MFMNSVWCFWLAGFDFLWCWYHITAQDYSMWQHIFFISPCCYDHLMSGLNVKKKFLCVCWRYIIYCGIPPVHIKWINHIDTARCTLSVSFLTDLDYGIVFELVTLNMCIKLKSFQLVYAILPIVSLYFACLLALVASTATAAAVILLSESITSQLWNQSWQN